VAVLPVSAILAIRGMHRRPRHDQGGVELLRLTGLLQPVPLLVLPRHGAFSRVSAMSSS